MGPCELVVHFASWGGFWFGRFRARHFLGGMLVLSQAAKQSLL